MTSETDELTGTSWTSRHGGRTVTLTFGPDGALSGASGVNRFHGTYEQDGSELRLVAGGRTLMAGPEDAMAQEEELLEAFGAVRSFRRDGAVLALCDGSGATLLSYDVLSSELGGTSWRATGINNGHSAVVSDEHTTRVTAAFGSDGTVSGMGGCNRYSGSWTAQEGRLTFGPIRATLKACESLDTEQAYFAALAKVATYERDGDLLRLYDADGATQVVLRPDEQTALV